MKALDLYGLRFTRLKVVERAPPHADGALWWHCKCDCGTYVNVRGADLKRGFTKSCGCLNSETTANRNRSHGMSHSRLYRIWQAMHDRTSNSNNSKYKYYGGRGIGVCVEWREFSSFLNWAISAGYQDIRGARRDRLTIDRINPDLGYEPSNCRWVTQRVQVLNRRPNATWRGRPVKRKEDNAAIQ